MKKVLIISYYWPPSGGAGVQRWLKLTKYLSRMGITPYVITVRDEVASYMKTDESLQKDVASGVIVHKTNSFEPINMYAQIVGKKNVPTAGFSNVDNQKFTQKLVNGIRSNFFIPDPRRGWNSYAYRKAVELIQKEGIEVVITTSPPHSTQLIGLKLQKNLGVKWVADLRDPWTDIYYYKILGHTWLSAKIDRSYENQVLVNSDAIITVGNFLKNLFLRKNEQIDPKKVHIIPNGYDHEDITDQAHPRNETFTIGYTGTMSDEYKPSAFFEALASVQESNPQQKIKLQIVGQISQNIENEILALGLELEWIPTVPHDKIIGYQQGADLLLLVIPDTESAEGILTGKIFEYLASGNPIICLGPENGDAAQIIDQSQTGATFERNKKEEMVSFIEKEWKRFLNQEKREPNWTEIEQFSRENQAKKLLEIISSFLN